MKNVTIFHINNRLLLKNLLLIYWHIAAAVLWLQGAVVLGGVAIALIDDKPVIDTMYLAFITTLTIGYGDMTPESGLSKIIVIIIGFIGVIFTGLVVAASLRALELTIQQQKTGQED